MTPREQFVYDLFRERGYERDVHILVLYYHLTGAVDMAKLTESVTPPPGAIIGGVRREQQYVGAYVRRVNMKLIGEQIVPGVAKQTYRLKTAN